MALKPSKIMAWQFTRELAASRRKPDSYSKWKANEEAAKQRSNNLKEKR